MPRPLDSPSILTWEGADRWMGLPTMIPCVLWLLGFYPLMKTLESAGIGIEAPGMAWVVGFLLLWIPPIMAARGRFRATLTAGEHDVLLRFGLGLRSTRLAFPLRQESGTLWDKHEDTSATGSDGYRAPGSKVHIGSYVRLVDGAGRDIIVGCLTEGPKLDFADMVDVESQRGRWHITVTNAAFAELQALLVDRGVLPIDQSSMGDRGH